MSETGTTRRVTVIEPRVNLTLTSNDHAFRKRRVAAYARVSTDEDEQLSSYEAQVDFYTRYISSNPEWEFVQVYADEGISGTNTKKRDGFNSMVADAMDGKIDLILTKSISRFARNTVDSLVTVRKLKEKGIEVYFEKENIYSLDSKGELLITIMSSLAQEESRSISENVIWGKRKKMQDGKVSLAYKHFLGYEKGEDDLPQIVESEAKIIRRIYRLFLEGTTLRNIAKDLTDDGIPTPQGKAQWSVSTIRSILSNEKYKGDAILQKTYTVDFLSKAVKKNNGEIPQYHIEKSHPAIIDPETWGLVQIEMARRNSERRHINNNSPFTAKIICGCCGGYFGSKVWHSTSKYRKQLWRCNRKYSDETLCDTPHIHEEELKQAFVRAFNRVLGDKSAYIAQFEEMLPLLADTSTLESRLAAAQDALDTVTGRMRRYMEENTRQIQNQGEYELRWGEMSAEHTKTEMLIAQIQSEIAERIARKERIRRYLEELRQTGDLVADFNNSLWQATVETVTVNADSTFVFTFRDGTEIPVKL